MMYNVLLCFFNMLIVFNWPQIPKKYYIIMITTAKLTDSEHLTLRPSVTRVAY